MIVRSVFSAALVAAAMVLATCGGGGGGAVSGSASVEVSYSVSLDIPVAQMPKKYASWAVEADGFLKAVNEAKAQADAAQAELAASLEVENSADAIADFIQNAIQVEVTLVCEPPSFNAELKAECTANASAAASGSAGDGQADGSASAGIEANCEASARLELKPGGCTLETTVTEHPILSNPEKWGKVEANMKIMLNLPSATASLNGRGDSLNSRGISLAASLPAEIAADLTLAPQTDKIVGELEKGAGDALEADATLDDMNSNVNTIVAAINAQFPELSASVSVN